MNQRSKLLNLADTLVNGDRNRQYGDPKSDFLKTAALWEVYLNGTHERHVAEEGEHVGILLDPHDVAALMILLKLSRLTWSPDKEDSWADIAGYAACGWDCVAEADPLDDDEEFQNDIAVDLDDVDDDDYLQMIKEILNPSNVSFRPHGGFLGGSLFPKTDR